MTRKTDPEAIARLADYLEPGDTVYCILRHRSASGMTRTVQLVTIEQDATRGPWVASLGYNAAAALALPYDRDREGVKVQGAGMDMGFWLVYELGRTLWPEGYDCIGDRCPSNDHSNGDRDHTPHRHRDGGYALTSRWM